MHELMNLPATRNGDLASLNRPAKLTLAEFEALEVSDAELKARCAIYDLEEHMFNTDGCVDDGHMGELGMTPVHRFVQGLYSRELTIPGDRIVVGKRHAVQHIVMVTAGRCLCVTERGMEELQAPYTFISPAGEKRVVFTYPDEPVTWVTLHPTTATDLDEVEAQVIIAEPERRARYALQRTTNEVLA